MRTGSSAKGVGSKAVLVALVLVSTAASATTLAGHQYLKEAKVDLQTARTKALKVDPGTIVSEELEKERGGSGLRYSFVVRRGNTKHEIGVDARTGAVLENSIEGAHAD